MFIEIFQTFFYQFIWSTDGKANILLRSNTDGDVIRTSIGEIFFKYISVAVGEPILTAKDEGRRKIQCHTINGVPWDED